MCIITHFTSVTVFTFYTPSRSLRSASDTLGLQLQILRTRLSTAGSRAFSVFGPSAWNDLPLPLRQKPSLDSFRSNPKTFLFPKQQTCHAFHPALLSASATNPRLMSVYVGCNLCILYTYTRVCLCVPVCACVCVYTEGKSFRIFLDFFATEIL